MFSRYYLLFIVLLFALIPVTSEAQPLVLLFDIDTGKDTAPSIAQETTKAIKNYLKESGKVEVLSFSPEISIIRRAVVEGTLKTEELNNTKEPEQQLKIARIVGADYAGAGTVEFENEQITISFRFAMVKSNRIWESKQSSSASGVGIQPTPLNISNSVQSAASTVVAQISAEALATVPIEQKPRTQTRPNPLAENAPPEDAAKLIEQADSLLKQDETAQAIELYRRAINQQPRSIDYRIKLAKAYVARGLPEYAANELTRAQQFDPDNNEISELLVAVYESKGASEKAAEVYLRRAERDPDDINAKLEAADVYWRQGEAEEAEALLLDAAKSEPENPAPRERLALLFASRGMFNASKTHLAEMQKLVKDEPESTALHRYNTFRGIYDGQTKHVMEQYAAGANDFESAAITHEKYYDKISDLVLSLESLTGLMEALQPPASVLKAHRHRLLGCSLLSQYGSTVISYLETKNDSKKKEAQLLLDAAKAQIQAASALDKK